MDFDEASAGAAHVHAVGPEEDDTRICPQYNADSLLPFDLDFDYFGGIQQSPFGMLPHQGSAFRPSLFQALQQTHCPRHLTVQFCTPLEVRELI
jgi:hypothetical protein